MKKRFLLLPFILLIVFASCDHRTSKKDHLKTAVSNFNKNVTLDPFNVYEPKEQVVIQTDSIISDTFQVSIKNYSNSSSAILLSEKISDTGLQSLFHRTFESDILVTVKDDIIFKKHISAAHFSLNPKTGFWKDATLEHVWVNQEYSNSTSLSLGISILNPKLKTFKLYEMLIDREGNETLNLIEETTS